MTAEILKEQSEPGSFGKLDPEAASRLAAARAGDHGEFSSLTEPYRRELQLHCYRILGSLQDAEDLVQETMLRAWRRLDTFEGRSSLRAWLYKIATNACLDALDKRPRRALSVTTHPAGDPLKPIENAIAEPIWLEPYPDDWLAEAEAGPEARYAVHESVSLAFLAVLQLLPPRQRAVLILRDVLDWRASEVAGLLEATVSAVNSVLHRARVTVAKNYHAGGQETIQTSPADTRTRTLLNRYMQAWEKADVSGLVALLKEDASFAMPPSPSWYRGREAIKKILTLQVFAGTGQEHWRLLPTGANSQPAFVLYGRSEDGGPHIPSGIQILTIDHSSSSRQISDITTFLTPELVSRFGLPSELTT